MILLVQIRSHPEPELHEQRCFVDLGGIAPERLSCHNVVHRPEIRWEDVEAAKALVIGGAGVHSATESYDFTEPLREVVVRWVEEGRPLLGSCWGHHFLAWALGGDVATDPAREEVGTFDVTLTEAGSRDELFAGLPPTFATQLGHHDRVTRLPTGMVELAYSERCPYQAVRVEGLPVYGTQFHCEMDEPQIRARLATYCAEYLGGSTEALDRILRPGPEAPSILRRFVAAYG